MRFITVREFRASTAKMWRQLKKERRFVLTRNGKPVAIVTSTNQKEVGDAMQDDLRRKALAAITEIQEEAKKQGLADMKMSEIDAIIAESRKNDAMLIVLDTNVIVSALLTSPGTCQQVLDCVLHAEVQMAVCDDILAEYQDVLARPRIKIPQDKAAIFLRFVSGLPSVVLEGIPPLALPDPDDEIFLAAALAAQVDYLVTGNLRHFPPHLRHGVNVVAPAQFLNHLPPP